MNKKKEINHIQEFKKLFGYGVAKEINGNLEYRVKGDLDYHRDLAAKIINKNKLNLKVQSTGAMSQIKAFEIVEA